MRFVHRILARFGFSVYLLGLWSLFWLDWGKCSSVAPEGVLAFQNGRSVQRQMWGLMNWFFLSKKLLSELIYLAQIRLSALDFGQFIGLGTENLPNLGISNKKLRNFVMVKMGVLWNWKMLKRGSCGAATHPLILFKVSTPQEHSQPYLSAGTRWKNLFDFLFNFVLFPWF